MPIISFKELFENLDGKSPFLEISGKVLSYEAFLKEVRKIASVPDAYDLPQGSRILVSLKNDLELITTAIGLMTSGMTVVLVDPETKGRRIKTIAEKANISGWIIDRENATDWNLPEARFNIKIEGLSQTSGVVSKLLMKKGKDDKLTFEKWIKTLDEVNSFEDIPLETHALILFTSGSTSEPKGVPLSHNNILFHLATLSTQYEIDHRSTILNTLPLYHVDGFIQGPLLTIFNACQLVRPFKFEVNKIEDLFYSVYKYRVSHFFVVPTMLQLFLKFGDSHSDAFKTEEFKYLISSAGVLDATLWMNIEEFFGVKIINVYGLTESVAGGFFCKPKDGKCRSGSIGKPVDIEARVVNENGENIADEQVGELLLKGKNIIDSYLIPNGNPDGEGWFRTGDLVYRDNDEFFYIKGRKKNVIIKGGVNIYAEEVIEVINQHPYVSESFVLGVSDELWGEKLIAVIASEDGLTKEQIIGYLKKVTEARNIPDSIIFVETLPKGDSGKIAVDEVKKLVQSAESKSPIKKEIATNEVKSSILKIASECFTDKVTSDQYHFNSLKIEGWNSLAHLQLATLLEKHFEIKLSVKDIMNITSLSEAEQIVKTKLY